MCLFKSFVRIFLEVRHVKGVKLGSYSFYLARGLEKDILPLLVLLPQLPRRSFNVKELESYFKQFSLFLTRYLAGLNAVHEYVLHTVGLIMYSI